MLGPEVMFMFERDTFIERLKKILRVVKILILRIGGGVDLIIDDC
jgi:hypothetical protein